VPKLALIDFEKLRIKIDNSNSSAGNIKEQQKFIKPSNWTTHAPQVILAFKPQDKKISEADFDQTLKIKRPQKGITTLHSPQ
jgi:hypothetical protein